MALTSVKGQPDSVLLSRVAARAGSAIPFGCPEAYWTMLSLLAMLVAFNGGSVSAGARQLAGSPPKSPPSVASSAKPWQRIGPRALLRVTVRDRPNLTNTYRVDLAGTVTLPELGQVSLNGLTLQEAADDLRTRLDDGRGRRPNVRVEFDHSLQSVFVAGEVEHPASSRCARRSRS